ncbi:phenylalanine--tRNA ligase subunit beta [Pseudobacteriovorax antillogorgiicola]|uniref:Phenylalanine--tRNA ligase beta subunit n=1 Tax=Pseudobacteriovorax antillogorgiicola TaxID=1513793 RepID=A0A1Y6CP25_9BACT|nr:phenylalanine--tRNA ligase subunit beta [Pseudobacteriovorax antillogorgiicola]TCS44441.1 phenylalanyl-tRNA synthetase beta subunit [Pseudobacteriovorax antillogorgiicola]SMF78800.1 phenylalanyl-tRNA synthetase beta subunit [Pseudobacteriovorax antillogorgiicola]
MKVSINWLNQYVDIADVPVDDIAKALTNLGLEVEGSEDATPLQGDVVVGKILQAEQHPNADKLQVCQVDVGESEPLNIVCGAPNARADLTVAVAKIGAVLPEDFKIKAGKIRGEKSFGMLCSGSELGLSDDSDGIMELDPKLKIGRSIVDVFNLKDTVLEIGLTPNRSDCLGYVGLARDLAAKLELELKEPFVPKTFGDGTLETSEHVSVRIENQEECGRFCALYVRNVTVIPSPVWMQSRLLNSGMRPINLIVDATNYAMLENGQPVHAYDERDIGGQEIIVRRAKAGETLVTLDDQTRTLSSDDLVISDANQAVGLAGVMGGANSEVKPDTKNIVIEVANFHPSLIRKSAKRHGLHTEASHRFERGVDIDQAAFVARRVAQLIQDATKEQIDQGIEANVPVVSGNLIDIYDQVRIKSKIALRLSRVRQVTGLRTISQETCIKHLQSLGFAFLDKTDDRMLFEVPTWRLDIERETDLIEEVVRLEGYDKVPYTLPQMEIGTLPENPLIEFTDQCKFAMAEQGFSEIISFPFISTDDLKRFNVPEKHPFHQTVALANPLVEEQSFLRTSHCFSLVKALVENRRHGIKGSRLFESARNFYKIDDKVDAAYPLWSYLDTNGCHVIGRARQDHRPIERNIVAGIIDQPFQAKSWNQVEVASSFFHGKEAILDLLATFDIRDVSFKAITAQDIPWLHPTASALVMWQDQLLGYLGELHPRTAKASELDFENPPIVFELDLEPLYKAYQELRAYQSSTIKFPPVTRDLAFVVGKSVSHDQFAEAFQSFNRRKNLSSYRVFDVYQGEHLDEGKKSMAFSLQFQSDKKTLTDKEVEKEVNALIDWFKEQLSAELR